MLLLSRVLSRQNGRGGRRPAGRRGAIMPAIEEVRQKEILTKVRVSFSIDLQRAREKHLEFKYDKFDLLKDHM